MRDYLELSSDQFQRTVIVQRKNVAFVPTTYIKIGEARADSLYSHHSVCSLIYSRSSRYNHYYILIRLGAFIIHVSQ